MANLAATIGSWEDDLSHSHIPNENTKVKAKEVVPKVADKDAASASVGRKVVGPTASCKTTPNSYQVS